MRIGFHLTPFWSPTTRSATALIDEAIRIVAAASRLGFAWVSSPHHWLAHPSYFPQPWPILARLAPESGRMRLKTNVLIMPLVHAIDTAENAATVDHICGGRLDVGLGIGYREKELEAAGVTRKDRVPKLEESIDLMKRLWAGEDVSVSGRYHKLTAGRLGFTPVQKPHPPIELAAQSVGATQRAARVADAVFFGPQVAFRDVEKLIGVYRDARVQAGAKTPGTIYASRSLIVGASKEKAATAAKEFLEKTFNTYRAWDMQERSMVPLQLGFDVSLDDWAVNGSPRDCVEAISRARVMGLDGIGFTMYALPREVDARIEYLQMIAEDVLKPAGAVAP